MSTSVTTPELLRRPSPVRRRRLKGGTLVLVALLKAVAVVAAPIVLVAWLLTSPYFAVAEIEIRGGERVPTEWVAASLESLEGENLWRVSLDGIYERLAQHPWVARVEIRRELPSRLSVNVVERAPTAVLVVGEGFAWLDGDGQVIAPAEPELVNGFVWIRGAASASAHPVAAIDRLVERVGVTRPGSVASPTVVTPLGESEYRIEGPGLPAPILVSASTLEAGLTRLDTVWSLMQERTGAPEVIDLRAPERIVVRPISVVGNDVGEARTEKEG